MDLRHIREFIAKDNPTAASLSNLSRHVTDLTSRLPGDGEGESRELPVRPYVIAWRVTPEAVEIVRIWHVAQSRESPSRPALRHCWLSLIPAMPLQSGYVTFRQSQNIDRPPHSGP
jgi:plasmid stabilization system protein ParE